MASPLDELLSRLEKIRHKADHQMVDRLCDEIEVLCRPFLGEGSVEAGPNISFTKAEQRLFDLFAARIGKAIAQDTLLDALSFDRDEAPDVGIVDVTVCYMRKKLLGVDAPYWIETVWGRGYRLHAEPLPAEMRKRSGTTKYVREGLTRAHYAIKPKPESIAA
jgi:DNA-binding response OmpR family regulator